MNHQFQHSEAESRHFRVGSQIRLGDSRSYVSVAVVRAEPNRRCAACRNEIAAGEACCRQDNSKLGSDLHWCVNCADINKPPRVSHAEGDSVCLEKHDCVAVAARARKKDKCSGCSIPIDEDELYYSVDGRTRMRFCVDCVESLRATAKGALIGALTFLGVLFTLAAGVALGVYWFVADDLEFIDHTPRPAPTATVCESNEAAAYILAQNAVERTLKVPGSVDFPLLGFDDIVITADNKELCTYKVLSTLEAQNVFGATLERSWSARVRYFKADKTFKVDFAKVLE